MKTTIAAKSIFTCILVKILKIKDFKSIIKIIFQDWNYQTNIVIISIISLLSWLDKINKFKYSLMPYKSIIGIIPVSCFTKTTGITTNKN